MKWAAAGALVLLCCARQETPAPPTRVAAKPAPVQPAPVPRPPPRIWRVTMLRSGGFAGGMQGFAAHSDGANRQCAESAVAAARPEEWARRYPDTSAMTDQFHYSLTLEADGRKFEASWSSGSGGVPPDLAQLSSALVSCR